MRRLQQFVLLIACLMLGTGCRKELCYNHDHHSLGVKIDIAATWETEWERDYGCGWKNCWDSGWGCSYDEL